MLACRYAVIQFLFSCVTPLCGTVSMKRAPVGIITGCDI